VDTEAVAIRLKSLELEREKKLRLLGIAEAAREEAFGNLRAVDGAIEDCRYWLGKSKPAPAQPEKETPQ